MPLNLKKRYRMWKQNTADEKNYYKNLMRYYPAIPMTKDNYNQVSKQIKSSIKAGKGGEWGILKQALQAKHEQYLSDSNYTGYFKDQLSKIK